LTDSINRQVIKYNENYVYISSLSLPKQVSDITSMGQDVVTVASFKSDDIYLNQANVPLHAVINSPSTYCKPYIGMDTFIVFVKVIVLIFMR
jgi:hypothetical protein